jgi:hypothetical protein
VRLDLAVGEHLGPEELVDLFGGVDVDEEEASLAAARGPP